MAELSYWWTTSGTPSGDQQSSYTQAHLATIAKILAGSAKWKGVVPDYLNELACTANGANTVAVNTGAAVVDGKPYINDASLNVNIPSAVGGGNTRIDRIVLRCTWASFEVAITRVAGVDAASPTAPSINDPGTPGTLVDLPLCQVLVNTSGTVTVTDERDFAKVDAASLENNAVTDVKLRDSAGLSVIGRSANSTGDPADIAAANDGEVLRRSGTTVGFGTVAAAGLAADIVDDTKVGNRVPQFYRRQGGSATVWSTPGTTTQTPTTVRQQAGVFQGGWTSGELNGTQPITFPTAFSQAPIVLLTFGAMPADTAAYTLAAINITASGFDIYWRRTAGGVAPTLTFSWLAVGPE